MRIDDILGHLYLVSRGFLIMIFTIVALYIIYSNGYTGDIRWLILVIMIITVFYPYYREFTKIKNQHFGVVLWKYLKMKTKEERKKQAWKEYLKIENPAFKEYLKKIKEIENENTK